MFYTGRTSLRRRRCKLVSVKHVNFLPRPRHLYSIWKDTVDGNYAEPHDLPRGYYVQPTLFTDVKPDMTIAQEEFFGPVLVVIPYDDEDDAVEIANNARNRIIGNYIGTDRTGTRIAPNQLPGGAFQGVDLCCRAHDNLLSDNVIAAGQAIVIADLGSNYNRVLRNRIGIGPDGACRNRVATIRGAGSLGLVRFVLVAVYEGIRFPRTGRRSRLASECLPSGSTRTAAS